MSDIDPCLTEPYEDFNLPRSLKPPKEMSSGCTVSGPITKCCKAEVVEAGLTF